MEWKSVSCNICHHFDSNHDPAYEYVVGGQVIEAHSGCMKDFSSTHKVKVYSLNSILIFDSGKPVEER